MEKPIIEVDLDAAGKPIGATATARIAASPARVWQFIENVEGYSGIVPMLHKVKRQGDRVTVHLKFKISLFSVGFDFTADATYEAAKWLELRWVAGEPRALRIRYELEDGGDGSCRVRCYITFDTFSLGWLAKYFLKHHPEIQFGIFPGCALALVDAMKRAAETK
jgi:ribosome-associated toxin RatA of RatAB toxin-antitoxin module